MKGQASSVRSQVSCSCSVTPRVKSLPGNLAGPAPNRLPESLLLLARSTEYLPRCYRRSSGENRFHLREDYSTTGENAVVLAQYSAEAWLGRGSRPAAHSR